MTIHRRDLLSAGAAASLLTVSGNRFADLFKGFDEEVRPTRRVHSVIPVVADGKWIWRDPPKDQTGYLEQRLFDVSVGIRWEGSGGARDIWGTTVIPTAFPEQEFEKPEIVSRGCRATIRQLDEGASQFCVAADQIARGQVVEAIVTIRSKLSKSYFGYEKNKFPADQSFEKQFLKKWTSDSPGIKSSTTQVRKLAAKIAGDKSHPWEKAHSFYEWVWENIEGKPGNYTSVREAIEKKIGDCEERAGVFIALCRASKIPARLVWIPNHSWAEFCLLDAEQKPHWIPAHTAAYSWFGWTGAHELVLQKGDKIWLPEKRKFVRLLADWSRWRGAKPKATYIATIKPAAEQGKDPGPGERIKTRTGEWKLGGKHPADSYMRK